MSDDGIDSPLTNVVSASAARTTTSICVNTNAEPTMMSREPEIFVVWRRIFLMFVHVSARSKMPTTRNAPIAPIAAASVAVAMPV